MTADGMTRTDVGESILDGLLYIQGSAGLQAIPCLLGVHSARYNSEQAWTYNCSIDAAQLAAGCRHGLQKVLPMHAQDWS